MAKKKCPQCGAINDATEWECVKCSADFSDVAEKVAQVEEEKKKAVTSPNKKVKEVRPTLTPPPDRPRNKDNEDDVSDDTPTETKVPASRYGHMTHIWTPALGRYGKSEPIDHVWMHFRGNKVTDETLLMWAIGCQDGWRGEYNEHLLPEAVHYICYWSKDPVLKENADRIRALLQTSEKVDILGAA